MSSKFNFLFRYFKMKERKFKNKKYYLEKKNSNINILNKIVQKYI